MRKEKPMKWYKFLIYFALIVSAISSFINALLYLINAFALTEGNAILTIVYIGCSIGLVANGILTITARQKLANRDSFGIAFFFGAVILGTIITTIGTIAGSLDTLIFAIPTAVINIIYSVVYLALNYVYFNKRMDYFC